MINTVKKVSANGLNIEIEASGVHNIFCLSGVATRAGKVLSTHVITGEKAGNWLGLFVPFKDESIKMAEQALIDALSKRALQNIANIRISSGE